MLQTYMYHWWQFPYRLSDLALEGGMGALSLSFLKVSSQMKCPKDNFYYKCITGFQNSEVPPEHF